VTIVLSPEEIMRENGQLHLLPIQEGIVGAKGEGGNTWIHCDGLFQDRMTGPEGKGLTPASRGGGETRGRGQYGGPKVIHSRNFSDRWRDPPLERLIKGIGRRKVEEVTC